MTFTFMAGLYKITLLLKPRLKWTKVENIEIRKNKCVIEMNCCELQ